MSRYLLPVLLSLLGCAGPAQYERGTMRPPARAPTFNPTTDSPNPYGHPRSEVPRSPHGRVLPQTPETRKEPGIWAVTPSAPSTAPEILGVPLPFGDGLVTPKEREHTYACATLMDSAARRVLGARTISDAMRRCLAATQYMTCMAAIAKLDVSLQEKGSDFDRDRSRRIDAALRAASAFEKEACSGPEGLSEERRELGDQITREADAIIRKGAWP